MLKQIFNILFFYLMGELVSWLIGGFLPGSVIGMVLLFVALSFKVVKPGDVRDVSLHLTEQMGLFFLPAGVGLMTAVAVIAENWAFLLLSSLISTILVIGMVGWMQQKTGKKEIKNG